MEEEAGDRRVTGNRCSIMYKSCGSSLCTIMNLSTRTAIIALPASDLDSFQGRSGLAH